MLSTNWKTEKGIEPKSHIDLKNKPVILLGQGSRGVAPPFISLYANTNKESTVALLFVYVEQPWLEKRKTTHEPRSRQERALLPL